MPAEPNDDSTELREIELADLVAYLDGELSEVDVELVEKRLVAEAPLREEVERLDKTWRLLESLEDVSASSEFTQKTLASMTATAAADDETDEDGILGSETSDAAIGKKTGRPFSVSQLAFWFVASFLFTGVGLVGGRWNAEGRQEAKDAAILRDLDFYEQFYRYRLIPNAKFLQELSFPSTPTEGVVIP